MGEPRNSNAEGRMAEGWGGLIKGTFRDFGEDKCTRMAAALS